MFEDPCFPYELNEVVYHQVTERVFARHRANGKAYPVQHVLLNNDHMHQVFFQDIMQ